MEVESNHRLKKQNLELQNNYTNLESDYTESDEKYQELYQIKQRIERDFLTQQATIQQETNAKVMALEKIQELQGRFPHQ